MGCMEWDIDVNVDGCLAANSQPTPPTCVTVRFKEPSAATSGAAAVTDQPTHSQWSREQQSVHEEKKKRHRARKGKRGGQRSRRNVGETVPHNDRFERASDGAAETCGHSPTSTRTWAGCSRTASTPSRRTSDAGVIGFPPSSSPPSPPSPTKRLSTFSNMCAVAG